MRKIVMTAFGLFLLVSGTMASPIDSLVFGSFGKVVIYKPSGVPKSVVLFVSGDGGWNVGVVDMAKSLAVQGALVAGIDIVHYYQNLRQLKVQCYYPAGDFEELSLMLQRKYKMEQYMKPILVGYSSGATLVYGILAQAPANTFKGAISLGFCPDIEISKPLCNGTGLKWHVLKEGKAYYLETTDKLTAPFIALQGTIDQVCSDSITRQFVGNMKNSEMVILPKVGHGFSVQANWLPQFLVSYKKVLEAPTYTEELALQDVKDPSPPKDFPGNLPVITITATVSDEMPLGLMISGDGGWSGFDQAIASKLAAEGIPMIGLDAQKYFWDSKTPEQTTSDMAQVIAFYMQQWKKKSIILVGYSFGADIVPFIANRLEDHMKQELRGVFALSPDEKADFEIHIADMLSLGSSKDIYDVVEEMKRIKPYHPVCIFGQDEDESLRKVFSAAGADIMLLPGSHHYNNNSAAVAEAIVVSLSDKK